MIRDTFNDTIAALSTPAGVGAIALVRLSGPDAVQIVSGVFSGRSDLREVASHTVHFGTVFDGEDILDEVVATVFRAPHSYTGEDVVEIAWLTVYPAAFARTPGAARGASGYRRRIYQAGFSQRPDGPFAG